MILFCFSFILLVMQLSLAKICENYVYIKLQDEIKIAIFVRSRLFYVLKKAYFFRWLKYTMDNMYLSQCRV